ncbi:MAG: glycosyltransferase family 4 protein [Saprospiraceae bacterium]|jgi:glycosyltransferase involved in cell wall biosynthesis
MKIAINARFLIANHLEGIGNFTLQIVKDLVDQYPSYHFYLIYDRKTPPLIKSKNVTNLYLLPSARHPILWYIWFEWRLPRLLKKHQIQKFISPDGFVSLRLHIPSLIVVHDLAYLVFPQHLPLLVKWYYQYFTPKFLAEAQLIVTVSRFVKNHIIESFSLPSDKIKISNNLPKALFQPLDPNTISLTQHQYAQSCPYFLYVGAIHPRKNILRLLLAFQQFKQECPSNMKLVIVGRKAWKNTNLKELPKNPFYKEEIIWTSKISDSELTKVLGAAFAMLYPSLFEGFGIPILEAQKAGVPVITSKTSSMPEVTGEGGLLVDPIKIEEIVSAMKQVYKDSQLRKKLIEKGFENLNRYTKEIAITPFSEWMEESGGEN